jgi:hypothetical protein
VTGNLNTMLAGTFHALRYRKYMEHYSAAFAYRFNRRFDLRTFVAGHIFDAVCAKPIKKRSLWSDAETRV